MSGTKAVDTIPLANINDPVNIATRQLNLVITMLTMGPETDIQRLGLWSLTPLSTNHTSAISWRSVLLLQETRVPGENQRSVASH
jgi:hypothetical protein